MTEIVILQSDLLPVNNSGRSDRLHRLGVSLDGVHHGLQAFLLSLTLRHGLAAHGVQVLLLGVVVPPPVLLALIAGRASTPSVRGTAASPLTGGCEVGRGGDLVLALVLRLVGHLLTCQALLSVSLSLSHVWPLACHHSSTLHWEQ